MSKQKPLLIGHNIHISKGLVSSAKYASSLKANFYQIFLGSPQTYKPKRQSHDDLDKLKQELDNYSMKIVIHASYMLNFCNPTWSYIHKTAISMLIADLKDSVRLGAIGVIIHMGKRITLDLEEAVSNYVKGLKLVLKNSPTSSTIILETGANVGTEVCSSIIDLGALRKRFTYEEQKRIKFCIDSCHVYSSGYDLGCDDYINDVFDKHIQMHLGWNNVVCVHLNDSKCKLNSCKDRHADIGRGCIGESGMKCFTKLCYKREVPMVLETPCEEGFTRSKQIQLVKDWCKL